MGFELLKKRNITLAGEIFQLDGAMKLYSLFLTDYVLVPREAEGLLILLNYEAVSVSEGNHGISLS